MAWSFDMHCSRHTRSNAHKHAAPIIFIERVWNHSATSKICSCPLSLHSDVFEIFTPSASICTNYAIYYILTLDPSTSFHRKASNLLAASCRRHHCFCCFRMHYTNAAYFRTNIFYAATYSVCIAGKQKHTSRPMDRRAQPWLWSDCATAERQRFFCAIASTRPSSRFAQMPNSALNSWNGPVFLSFSPALISAVGGCCLIFTPHTSALRFCTAFLW